MGHIIICTDKNPTNDGNNEQIREVNTPTVPK